jgi:hypothetical protein
MRLPTVTINLDAKCADCGKGGRLPNTLCLSCTTAAISGKRLKTRHGRHVAQALRQRLKEERRP